MCSGITFIRYAQSRKIISNIFKSSCKTKINLQFHSLPLNTNHIILLTCRSPWWDLH